MRSAGSLAMGSSALLVALALAGHADGRTSHREATARLSAMAQLGEKLFFDPTLSASGRQSCASCHDPAKHFGPPDGRPVQLGGADGRQPGIRAVPSLAYLDRTPAFTIGPESLEDKDVIVAVPGSVDARPPAARTRLSARPAATPKRAGQTAQVPRGGLFWDGRADTLQQQTLGPLLSPFEMANSSQAALLAKLRRVSYSADFIRLFGAAVFADPRRAIDEASFALARFEIEDPRFHPYSSRYDAYLQGKATLTRAERRGLTLFDEPSKGNCAACHLDRPSPDGRPPSFTDHEYEALAVPRNRAIPANADRAYFDLGICGPVREDAYAHQPANCGRFKTPTLRNVATRQVYFHNGVYHSLAAVLHFYASRDADPGSIYARRADGSVVRYDDLPPKYRANVDHVDPPFANQRGGKPALTKDEIADLIAFLKTLTDR